MKKIASKQNRSRKRNSKSTNKCEQNNDSKDAAENTLKNQHKIPSQIATDYKDTNIEFNVTMGHPSDDQRESETTNMNSYGLYDSNCIEQKKKCSSNDAQLTTVTDSECLVIGNKSSVSEEANIISSTIDITETNATETTIDIVPIDQHRAGMSSDTVSNSTAQVNPKNGDTVDQNPCTSNSMDKPSIQTDSGHLNVEKVPCTPGYSEGLTHHGITWCWDISNTDIDSIIDSCNEGSSQSNTPSAAITSDIQDKDISQKEVFKVPHKMSDRESEIMNLRKVDIYTEDTGPHWYNVNGNVVTPPMIPLKLPDVFDCLPVFGRPSSKAGLKEFQDKKIREFIGFDLTDEKFEILAKYCSPEHLITGKELVMPTNIPMPGLVNDMQTLSRIQVPDTDEDAGYEPFVVKNCRIRKTRDPSSQFITKLKYRGMRVTPNMLEEDIGENDDEDVLLDPGRDILFRVRVYRAFQSNQRDKPNSRRHSVFGRDVVLTGRHALSALRDRIQCANDLDLRVDVSDRPNETPRTCAKNLFPSGFLFINNVFYVDERAGCRDLSAGVRAWAAARGLGRFPHRGLAATRLQDLVLKLGHPEVYVHQGNCEHLFTFSEIRLLGAADALRLSSYPCHTWTSQHHMVYCTTCAEFGAKWVVSECDRVPFAPAYFCDPCFRMYLYTGGEKVGQFKAYSYMGNEVNAHKAMG